MGRIYLILALFVLASCGLFVKHTQKITINSANGKPATCLLENDLGEWQAPTNQAVVIKKSDNDLKITCSGKNIHAHKLVKAEASHIYPSTVTVYLKARKLHSVLPKDEPKDEEEDDSPSEIDSDNNNTDDSARPLNMLTNGPEDNNENEKE